MLLMLLLLLLHSSSIIKVHSRLVLRNWRSWMIGTAVVICAKFGGLILASVGLKLTSHGRCIGFSTLLPPVVSISLLVLLSST